MYLTKGYKGRRYLLIYTSPVRTHPYLDIPINDLHRIDPKGSETVSRKSGT